MKILYLTDLLSPYRTAWMNLLSKEYDIDTYFFDEAEKTRESSWLNSIENQFKKYPVKSRTVLGIRFSSEIFKILREKKYDIYIVDGYASFVQVKAITMLAKEGKNVFVNVDGIDIWRKEGIPSKLKWIVKSRLYRSGAKFLCGSNIAVKKMIDLGAEPKNVFKHPFTTIYKSDVIKPEDKTKLQSEYKKLINCEGKKVAVAVGRFIPLKRYDDLIKAWKGIGPDCVLFLIGSGELKDRYLKLIDELSIKNICILDHMSRDELDKYYLAADVFIHTSGTEVWGLVFNEAMSKGCPVISTNHCVGAVELIKDGKNGYLINVGDINALHNKIVSVLSDDKLRHDMINNSLKTISEYTYENLANTHTNIFKEALRNRCVTPKVSKNNIIKRYFFAVVQRFVAAYYKLHKGQISVLMFHKVCDSVEPNDNLNIKTETFLRLIEKLKAKGTVFSDVDDIFKAGKKTVISFDDVYYATVKNAVPYLEAHNIPYVLFLSPALIDKEGYITSTQIKELSKSPLCTIGFHSNDHIFMRGLNKTDTEYEADCSNFEKEYGVKCDYFAYPYGSVMACSLKNIRFLKKSNYKAAFGTVNAKTNRAINSKHPYYIPRITASEKTFRQL